MSYCAGIADDGSRLFVPFFDGGDMVALFPAGTTLGEVCRSAEERGLAFPLAVDPAATLAEQFAACDHAPASARFGALVDNVPGMNFELPGGRRVRVGERVVKSTTGYDLLRFLLHTGERFGRATDYVLRLRPLSPAVVRVRFSGEDSVLARVRRALAADCWAHWVDCADQIFQAGGDTRISVECRCMDGEEEIFREHFRDLAGRAGADCADEPEDFRMALPALSIKTTPGDAPALAARCRDRLGVACRAHLFNGVVSVAPLSGRAPGPDFPGELAARVEPLGGHVMGPLAPVREPSPGEARWIDGILSRWRNL